MAFILNKAKNKIDCLTIFGHNILHTAYADDTFLIIKNLNSVLEVLHIFEEFLSFSGLKLNSSKYKIARIGALKEVRLALS